jgi:hypothetical protein
LGAGPSHISARCADPSKVVEHSPSHSPRIVEPLLVQHALLVSALLDQLPPVLILQPTTRVALDTLLLLFG